MSDAHIAESVVWQVARCWLGAKVREDEEALNRLLSEGWEPFHVTSSGRAGYVYHLRRAQHSDGSMCS